MEGLKSEGKRPLGRCEHSLEDNIQMDLDEIGCEDVDCIHVAQKRDQWWVLVNMAVNLCDELLVS